MSQDAVPPLITIIDATPQKTAPGHPLAGMSTSTSSSHPYRLLYRGALSLPDSYIQLDGIAFSARLPGKHVAQGVDISARATPHDSPTPTPSLSAARAPDVSEKELMYNPLALALESMRGRQTLRFVGTVNMEDLWTDDSGEVYMDIHPCATLTKIYFENVLCLAPLVGHSSLSSSSSRNVGCVKRTQVGVRVSLGDADGPETTDIVIYGEMSTLLHPPPLPLQLNATSTDPSPGTGGPPPLNVRVARITPAPRAPRPDDPTPRKPPSAHVSRGTGTLFSDLGKNKRITSRSSVIAVDYDVDMDMDITGVGSNGKGKGKGKGKSKGKGREVDGVVDDNDAVLRRAREVMLHLPRPSPYTNTHTHMNGGGGGGGKAKEKNVGQWECANGFKVPELPAKVRRKQGGGGGGGTDVFGAVEQLPQHQNRHQSSAEGKGKDKSKAVDVEGNDGITSANSIEDANKLVLKKMTVNCLSNAGIPRSHSEFKDIFGFVYRGAAFALRSQVKASHISTQAAEATVEAHVKMYVLTLGGSGPHDPSGG